MTIRNPPPRDLPLMARTAEALALPEMVCRRRGCRRSHRCHWHFRGTGEPCCLANLDADQRALFDRICALARDARDFGSWQSKIVFASPYRGERDMQDAAVEIARPLVSKAGLRFFRKFMKMRDRHPPPHRDGFQPSLPKR